MRTTERQNLFQITSLEMDVAKAEKALLKARDAYAAVKGDYEAQVVEAGKLRTALSENREVGLFLPFLSEGGLMTFRNIDCCRIRFSTMRLKCRTTTRNWQGRTQSSPAWRSNSPSLLQRRTHF